MPADQSVDPQNDKSFTTPGTPRSLTRNDGWIAVGLVALVLALGACRMVVNVCGLYHDDGLYVITAQALAEGEGYRLVNLPGSPPQTKYPVLLPAVFSLIWRIWPSFPDNLLAMKGFCLLCAAGLAGLGYLYVVRFGYFSRPVASAATLLCITAPQFSFFAVMTLSEMPFGLLFLVVCWVFDGVLGGRAPQAGNEGAAGVAFVAPLQHGQDARATRWGRAFALGVLATLPFWCRTIGVALLPAIWWMAHRAGHRTRWIMAGSIAGVAPWAVWVVLARQARDPAEGYYTDYFTWWLELGVPFLARVFSHNLWSMLWSPVGLGAEGLTKAMLDRDVPLLPLTMWIGLFAVLPMLRHIRQGRVMPACLAAYLLLVAVWPWTPYRFLIPVLPVIVGYTFTGLASATAKRLSLQVRVRWGTFAVALAASVNLAYVFAYAELSRITGCPYNDFTQKMPTWQSYEQLYGWLRRHSAPEAVVATEMDPLFYFYADRRGFRPFVINPGVLYFGMDGPVLGTPDAFLETLQRNHTRYVVVTPWLLEVQPFAELVEAAREREPGSLQEVYRDPLDGRFAIFEVMSVAAPTAGRRPTMDAPDA